MEPCSWVMIVDGLNTYVTEMTEATQDDHIDYIGESTGKLVAKARLTQTSTPTTSSTATLPYDQREWIDAEPGPFDRSCFEVSKKDDQTRFFSTSRRRRSSRIQNLGTDVSFRIYVFTALVNSSMAELLAKRRRTCGRDFLGKSVARVSTLLQRKKRKQKKKHKALRKKDKQKTKTENDVSACKQTCHTHTCFVLGERGCRIVWLMLMRALTARSQRRKTDRLIYTSWFVHVICSSRIVLIRPGTVTEKEKTNTTTIQKEQKSFFVKKNPISFKR